LNLRLWRPLIEVTLVHPLWRRTLLPIVQGRMGVGISAHRLAGSVAALVGVGTISSVDRRRHHPDLTARIHGLPPGEAATDAAKRTIEKAKLEAIDREFRAAPELAGGRGLVTINVMRAVSDCAASLKQALECGIDAVVVGAGLPLELPDISARPASATSTTPASTSRTSCPKPPPPWLNIDLKAVPDLQRAAHPKPHCAVMPREACSSEASATCPSAPQSAAFGPCLGIC
jgi:NAD(P)H-dependent flavin oxidoreductase YrpB (nitropropane dioxygenase family)